MMRRDAKEKSREFRDVADHEESVREHQKNVIHICGLLINECDFSLKKVRMIVFNYLKKLDVHPRFGRARATRTHSRSRT